MAEDHGMAASIDQMQRLFSDVLLPGLHRERSTIEHLLEHARATRQAIREHVDDAFEQLDSPLQVAEEALSAIEERAGTIGGSLSSTMADAVARVGVLAGSFDQQVEEVGANFQTLADAVVSGDQASTQALEDMRGILTQMQAQLSEHMQQLEQGESDTETLLAHAASTVAEKLAALESTLGQFEQASAQGLAALAEAVESRSHDVGADIRTMLANAGDAVGDLRQSSEQVLGAWGLAGSDLEKLMDSNVGDVMKDVQQLLDLVEQIKPLLEIIEEWA